MVQGMGGEQDNGGVDVGGFEFLDGVAQRGDGFVHPAAPGVQ